MKYKACLFSPDGDWVTDYRGCETIQEVWDNLADMGSRWFFYPFHTVIRDNGLVTTHLKRIVEAGEPFADLAGCTIQTFAKMLKEHPQDELTALWGDYAS